MITDKKQIDQNASLSYLRHHPHYSYYGSNDHNTIYAARAFGTLKFSEELQLTKVGYQRRYWELPGFFRDVEISYHDKSKYQYDQQDDVVHLNSTRRGQEFVMAANCDLLDWVETILTCRDTTSSGWPWQRKHFN